MRKISLADLTTQVHAKLRHSLVVWSRSPHVCERVDAPVDVESEHITCDVEVH